MADLFYPDPGNENESGKGGDSLAKRVHELVWINTDSMDWINQRGAYPRSDDTPVGDTKQWEFHPHLRLPADGVAESLASFFSEDNDRMADGGLEQTEDDRLAHFLLANRYQDVFGDIGGIVVIGEEAPLSQYAIWKQLKIGEMYIILDAIDGTLPREVSGEGASINTSVFLRTSPIVDGVAHDTLLATVTTKTSGTHLIGQHPSSTFGGHRKGPIVRLAEFGCPAEEVRFGSVAVVAAQGHHRQGAPAVLLDTTLKWGIPAYKSGSRMIDNPSLTVNTAGGAPSLWAYASGHLETVVFPKDQTVHDVTGILAAAALGGFIFLIGGEEIGLDELKYRCSTVAGPDSPAYRPVPALVMSRDEHRGRLIAVRMGQVSGWTELMAVDPGEPPTVPADAGDITDDPDDSDEDGPHQ